MTAALKRTPYARLPEHTARAFDEFGAGYLPGLLGLESSTQVWDAVVRDER